jgi:hypothetical protein
MLRNLNDRESEKPKENIFENLETHLVDLNSVNIKTGKHEESNMEDFKRDQNKSKTTKNLSWLSSVKKVSTSIANSRLFVKGDGELLFCIDVDGSKHSDFAFEMVTENFLFPYTKLLCIYVYNSKLDSILNYNNKKTTVLEKYASKIEKFKKQSHFVTEDRVSKTHTLEQAERLAENYNANFLVCGYQGLKGPRGDNKEQEIGTDYLLSASKTPVMIVREETKREKKKDGVFRWLVIMDRQYTYTAKAFSSFIPLIDASKDFVHCFGGYPNSVSGTDVLEDQFKKLCEKNGIKNSTYEPVIYSLKKSLAQLVIETINFGDTIYDFVIIYNNSGKFKADPDSNDASNIIHGTTTNVLFVNN